MLRSGRLGISLLATLVFTVAASAGLARQGDAELTSVRVPSANAYVTGAQNVHDSMSRAVANGFGTAQQGGRYATWAAKSARLRVGAGVARIDNLQRRSVAYAALPSVRASDQQLRVSFRVTPSSKRGNGEYVKLELRRISARDTYRVAARVAPDGSVYVNFSRVRHGVESSVGSTIKVPQRARPGQYVTLDGLVAGSSSVVLLGRAWVSGSKQPAWQNQYTDTSSARLGSAGAVGVWTYTAGNSDAASIRITQLDGWLVKAAPRSHPAPAPTAPAPTSPKPTPTSSTPPPTHSSTPVPPPSSTPPGGSSSAPPSGPTSPEPPTSSSDIGALAIGTARYAAPANALFVSSSDGNDGNSGTQASPLGSVRAAVARAGAGQAIVLRQGNYHESISVAPSKSVTIQAYPGEAVWFDGSVPVTNWARSGSTWVAAGWGAQFDSSASFTSGSNAGGFVNPAYPMAAHPDQVFLDGKQLAQVAAGTTPGAGQFAVNYSARTITVGTDPAGHAMRASDLSQAFVVSGRVKLLGVGVRRYATSLPQIGTVYLGGSVGGDVLENVVIQDNAGQGLSLGTTGCTVNRVSALDNGMTGIHSNRGSGSVIENSLISGNNTQHFNAAPSAGGIKITRVDGFTIRHNEVTHNLDVNGIWTDVSARNFVIADNLVAANGAAPYGILTELSDTGFIAGNRVSGAKYGITVFDTGNVRVFNNTLSSNSVWDIGLSQDERRNSDPATSSAIPWVVRNIVVDNNEFGTAGSFQFYVLDKRTRTPASSMNITIDGNVFPVSQAQRQPVMAGWGGGDNVSVAYYRTPAQLNSGANAHWTNLQSGGSQALAASSQDSIAVPLPADVAAALGVPAGTRHVGAF